MKFRLPLLSLLFASTAALAGEPVNLDVYLQGKLRQHVSMQGANASYKFWLGDQAGTVLQLYLISPEPLIVDVEETTEGSDKPYASGRVKLVGAGSSAQLSELQGAAFRHPFVLVRPE
jgi:hypothetical protein